MLNLDLTTFVKLDESISVTAHGLQFKNSKDVVDFINQTGIKQYFVDKLKLKSDSILIIDESTIAIHSEKIYSSAVRNLCTATAIKIAKKSL